MKPNYLVAALLSTILFITGCSKKDSPPVSPSTPTSLKISVSYAAGGSVSGATVKLYATDAAYTTALAGGADNNIGSKTTDGTGNVTFTNLGTGSHHFSVQMGCTNNTGSFSGIASLTPNTENSISTLLSGTGTLKFVNSSSNPYDVYINGVLKIQAMAGGTTQNYFFTPVGNYTIRVLQKSGYLVTPTDKTYTGAVTCGSTLTTTFP